MYSTSALDHATTICFLLFEVTRLPLKNVQYLIVDHDVGQQALRSKLEKGKRETERRSRKARENKRKKLGEKEELRGKKTTSPCQ